MRCSVCECVFVCLHAVEQNERGVECCFVNRCVMERAVICVYSLPPCVMETASNTAAASSCVSLTQRNV